MAVIFPILSTFNPAGVNQAQGAFKGLSGVAKTSALAFGALGLAVGKFGVDAVKAAAEDQKAQLKLAKTLQNVTKATKEQTAAVEKFITTQQFATGVSDTQLRPALETLVRATGDVTKAQNLLKLGLDVSAGSGRDLESISLALAKAQGGQFTALQRLGIVIPENIKKSKDFAKVQEYLNTLFGGQAAVAADTFAGKLQILKQRLSEAQETIGATLIPILTKLIETFLNNVMPAIERVAKAFGDQGLSGGLRAAGTEISNMMINMTGLAKVISEVILTLIGMKIAMVFMATAPGLILAIRSAMEILYIATLLGSAGFGALAVAIRGALASTGIGLLVVGLGLLIGKLIEAKLVAGATDQTITFMESNGVNSFKNMGQAADLMNGKIAMNIVTLNAVSLAATRANEALDNMGIKRVKQGKVPIVATPKIADEFTSGATKAIVGLSEAAKQAQKQMASFNTELQRNNDILAKAKDAYNSFKSGITSVITGIINFGEAATAETGSFLENLVAQASKAQDFGTKVKQLLAMGLSESAISQVLAAGADAGTKIADEIIAGGATIVDQINTLITATQSVADALGESAAVQFYQAGITAGQALVDGVRAAIAAAGFSINLAGEIVNQAAIDKVNAAVVRARKTGKGISSGEKKTITDLANALGVDVPKLAAGGIVTKPTLAMIGEAGPEAVIPLSGGNAGMGGNVYNINVNAGMGTNGVQVGKEIVDAIKRFEKTSGPVFASA